MASVVKRMHGVPVDHPVSSWNQTTALGGDLLALHWPFTPNNLLAIAEKREEWAARVFIQWLSS